MNLQWHEYQSRQYLYRYRERLTSLKRLREKSNSGIVVLERGAILMVKPAKLLEDFGMLGVCLDDAFISVSRATVLTKV